MLNDNQKYEYLLNLLPEDVRRRFDCAACWRNLSDIKLMLFSVQNESQDGAVFGSYKKIAGGWHKVRKDGSYYSFGLSRPCPEIEKKYIAALPDYRDYVECDAYFSAQAAN